MIHIRPMSAADLPLGLRLSRQADWNQTQADWQRCLDLQPDGCFAAEWDGTPVGTTTTCIFDRVAWIAMVLVDEAARGCGIGTALLNHALAFLDLRGVATVRLDATPAGQPLYERLGFIEQFQVLRYEGTLPSAPRVLEVEDAVPGQYEALAAMDKTVTGTDRGPLLFRLFAEQRGGVRVVQQGGRPVGFLTSRQGHRAIQLGPGVATTEAGALLLADAWHRYADQRVFLDLPVSNRVAIRMAEAQGLTVQRHLTRMCRGIPLGERAEEFWISSGPEKG